MIALVIRVSQVDVAEEVANEMLGIVPDLPPSVFRRRFISAYKPLAGGYADYSLPIPPWQDKKRRGRSGDMLTGIPAYALCRLGFNQK